MNEKRVMAASAIQALNNFIQTLTTLTAAVQCWEQQNHLPEDMGTAAMGELVEAIQKVLHAA